MTKKGTYYNEGWFGKPFSKYCPELHGTNSYGLCLTIRFSVAEAAFKKQPRTDS